MTTYTGVHFPRAEDGSRPSTPVARAVVADALATLDQEAARAAREETSWRQGYRTHLRRLALATSPDAEAAATAGASSLASRMVWVGPDGTEVPLADLPGRHTAPADGAALVTHEVRGSGTPEVPGVPVDGDLLTGERLVDRLRAWHAEGLLEPGVVDAVRAVLAHPEWTALPGRTLLALGATSEIAPTRPLLRWGATVAAVNRPDAERWAGLTGFAAGTAGRLLCPTSADGRPGADLLADLPAVLAWARDLEGPLVLGNYLYADGGTNLRLAAAADALAVFLGDARPDLAFAFLASPADLFLVPSTLAREAARRRRRAPLSHRLWGVRPSFAAEGDAPLVPRGFAPADNIVPQQGPNYLVAKRSHRWRALLEQARGRTVSINVAPICETRSVLSHELAARAARGIDRFGLRTMAPETASALMALLLVHDLYAEGPLDRPETDQAVHGGMWTAPWTTPSILRASVVRDAATGVATAPARAAAGVLGGPLRSARRRAV